MLRESLYKINYKNISKQGYASIETPAEQKERISEKINTELDLIGISSHLKGRQILFDAILYLILEKEGPVEESVFQYLVKKYKRVNSSISRAMQTAINYAWSKSPIEDLEIYYTAKINYATGVPNPTEFIYYYRDKLRKFI